MFTLAVVIYLYSLLILTLGLLGLLTKVNISFVSLILVFITLIFFLKKDNNKTRFNLKAEFLKLCKDKLTFVLFLILLLQIIVNLIGVFGPELSFDALWYHLTLPKLYILNSRIFPIKGGLLYYSSFPQLTEMLYTAALAVNNEILAKFTHFLFGLFCLFSIYQLLKKFGKTMAIFGCVLFYTQLVVGWLSTTAYIDLVRVFFEILAFNFFLKWSEDKNNKKLLLKSSILIGFAISTKLLSFYSLASYLILILIFSQKTKIRNLLTYLFFALLVPLPWFILSFLKTGNPVYPLFTSWFFKGQSQGLTLGQWLQTRNIISFVTVYVKTVFTRGDILTPALLLGLPLIIYKKNIILVKEILVVLFFTINYIFFFFTPLNYNRFLLPYIPVFIYLVLFILKSLKKDEKVLKSTFILVSLFIAIVNLLTRGLVNYKFVPVIIGKESKSSFLSENLNFDVGNFYDIDGWFKENIKGDEKALVYGVHNLFYLDFPFDHISWVNKETYYSYIIDQNDSRVKEFANLPLLYENSRTRVKVYKFRNKI
ncbi:ArnT family glycosyltransferase [Patescibacteria group bacterium]